MLDERAKETKEFVTTWIDVDFPIEYKESACNLTIKIEDLSTTCFTINSKVKCEADLNRKRDFRMGPSEELRDDSSSTLMVAIICATVLAVTVVIAITVISTVVLFVKKKQIVEQERQREEEERNDLYGTYYQGVEYNTVIDNNPRYNEDERNAENGKTSFRGAEYNVASEFVKIL